jgi:hypothetical protein
LNTFKAIGVEKMDCIVGVRYAREKTRENIIICIIKPTMKKSLNELENITMPPKRNNVSEAKNITLLIKKSLNLELKYAGRISDRKPFPLMVENANAVAKLELSFWLLTT